MKRRLIAMLSTKDKTPEELKAAALQVIQKWQDAQQEPTAEQ